MKWKNAYQGIYPEDLDYVKFYDAEDGTKETGPILCKGKSGDYWITTRKYCQSSELYQWGDAKLGVFRWSLISDD